jgi:hypothetical protein
MAGRPTDEGRTASSASHSRRRFLVGAGAALCAAGCGSSGRATGATRLLVSGTVSDRIEGGPIDGSTITFRGAETRSGRVSGGRYEVADLPDGPCEVTIAGPAHVEHKDLRRAVSASNASRLDFTVLKWGASRFGATYDRAFDAFFRLVSGSAGDGVSKWLVPPRSLYVTDRGLTSAGLARLLALLESVAAEDVPAMFGGRIGPPPVEIGPTLPSNRRDGSIVIAFPGGTSNGVAFTAPGRPARVAGTVSLAASHYDDALPTARYVLSHELFHVAFASHARGAGIRSVMEDEDTNGTLTPADRLASWLVSHDDCQPGNRAPDTNPGV